MAYQSAANAVVLRDACRLARAVSSPYLELDAATSKAAVRPNPYTNPNPITEAALTPRWHYGQRWLASSDSVVQGGVLTCIWSATSLPLRSQTVDVAVVDLPFGIVHKVKGGGGVAPLYAQALLELSRVMRQGSPHPNPKPEP